MLAGTTDTNFDNGRMAGQIAQDTANSANDTANNANDAANEASKNAQQAIQDAENAKNAAEQAKEAGDKAAEVANNVQNSVDQIGTDTKTALDNANTALSKAEDALSKANVNPNFWATTELKKCWLNPNGDEIQDSNDNLATPFIEIPAGVNKVLIHLFESEGYANNALLFYDADKKVIGYYGNNGAALDGWVDVSPTDHYVIKDIAENSVYTRVSLNGQSNKKVKIEFAETPTDWCVAEGDKPNKADIIKIQTDVEGIKSQVANAVTQSDIAQAVDNIVFSVKNSDGSHSEFYMDKNTILMDSSKIILDGSVSIKDGTIGTAQIGSLSANVLTSGTIDASKISVDNLNANNIHAGTLSGIAVKTNDSGTISDGKGASLTYTESMTSDKEGIKEHYTLSNSGGGGLYDLNVWVKDGSIIFGTGSQSDPSNDLADLGRSYFLINQFRAYLPPITTSTINASGSISAGNNIGMGYSPHTINSIDGGDLYFQSGVGSGNPAVGIHSAGVTANGDINTSGSITASSDIVSKGGISANTLQAGYIYIDANHRIYASDGGDIYFGASTSSKIASLHAAAFKVYSQLSIKKDIEDYSGKRALEDLKNTDIKTWKYKADKDTDQIHIGPIIDDVNKTKKYKAADNFVEDGISINNIVGSLVAAVKEQQKELETLQEKVSKLEKEEI